MDPELTRRLAAAIKERQLDQKDAGVTFDTKMNLSHADGGFKRGEMVVVGAIPHFDEPKSMLVEHHVNAMLEREKSGPVIIDVENDVPGHAFRAYAGNMSSDMPLVTEHVQDAMLAKTLSAEQGDVRLSSAEALALKVQRQLDLMEEGLRLGHVPEEIDEEFFNSLGLHDELLKADTLDGLQKVADRMRMFHNRIRELDRRMPKVMGKTVFVKKRHSKARKKGKRK